MNTNKLNTKFTYFLCTMKVTSLFKHWKMTLLLSCADVKKYVNTNTFFWTGSLRKKVCIDEYFVWMVKPFPSIYNDQLKKEKKKRKNKKKKSMYARIPSVKGWGWLICLIAYFSHCRLLQIHHQETNILIYFAKARISTWYVKICHLKFAYWRHYKSRLWCT
jgi:hypothetical protein